MDIFSIYDTSLNDSMYTLSLFVNDSTASTVIISNHQGNLTVYISDLHGMFYEMLTTSIQQVFSLCQTWQIGRARVIICSCMGRRK